MNNVAPVDEEYTPDGSVMISEMNLEGTITFANRKFCEVSAYELNELVGQNHSITRHPDMPKTVFTKMWQTLEDSQSWNGVLKSIRKDGHYYWSETEIIPIYDENDAITGYMSARRVASRKNIQEAEELYEKMLKS
ncbi:MAG: PAS domain S-box protein [Sulfurimonas sp.]|uniref:PAS domain-containing protein n=1 Tax=Sulfurimonas sp. TaxID=2022749 RepID=UPI0025FAA310|nr:PAS domain S-box protein [Sulfurimonas sp.]MCK9492417.1 PAS domain S-box protein [Sulfurimonas sp.]